MIVIGSSVDTRHDRTPSPPTDGVRRAHVPCPPLSRSLSSVHQGKRTEEADVKLINTDGMAFIGPGSEWFWTALSGIILAVTFIAIYRQLKLQRSREAIDQVDAFEREWATERMCRIRLNALIAYRDASDPADLDVASVGLIAIYWEKVASLVRRGHIDPQLLWHISGFNCVAWWLILGPSIRKARTDEGDPTTSADFEWLAGTMAELDRKAGVPAPTEARVAADIGTMGRSVGR